MSDVAEFLGRYKPFSHADPGGAGAAGRAPRSVVSAPPGASILIEDGAVSRSVYVVRSGAVELVHEDEVVDVLDVGEVFGHPSMLTGRGARVHRARPRAAAS